MHDELRNLTWTLMLLSLYRAVSNDQHVEYQQQHICAVKGSSVVIPCSFNYPEEPPVDKIMWGREGHIFNGPFIFEGEPTYKSSKYDYIGDKRDNCSLKIDPIEHNDAGKYAFRFITANNMKWTGQDGSTLKVVDLLVSVIKSNGNGTMKEGDSVNLTCINGCDDSHLLSAFTWLKNGKPIKEGAGLYITNTSSTDSGNYTCSLKTHPRTTSAVINIDVEYGPKNTSVTVRPSMEVDAGSIITLTCSSHANPPVENYTWFKIDDDNISIAVGHQPVFFSGDGGWYLCSATNKHGSQNSSVVTLKMKTFNRYLLIIPTVAVLLVVTMVVVVIRICREKTRAPKTECEDDVQNTVYANWPVFDNQCEGATPELIYTTVVFHTKRKSNMEPQMDSHHDDTSVIYSTVCRDKLRKPSYIETL